jgi:hypothetical protein
MHNTNRFDHRAVLALLGVLSLCPASWSYQSGLDSAAIGEAYALGQRNDRLTAAFVAPYLKQVTEQALDGLHRADIEILTPYLQIVDCATDTKCGESLTKVAKEYHERGDTIVIRISLIFPSDYPAPETPGAPPVACDNTALQPQNFWKNFSFVVTQHNNQLTPRKTTNTPVYSTPTKDAPAVLDGATVSMEFPADAVASEPLFVQIFTPRCKTIQATFDLAALR